MHAPGIYEIHKFLFNHAIKIWIVKISQERFVFPRVLYNTQKI